MIQHDHTPRREELPLEALRCPFCWRGGEMVVLVTLDAATHFVRCRACLAQGPQAGWIERAVELWNNRKDGKK